MVHEIMHGINKDAVTQIVSQIRKRKADSAEEIETTASILGAYDALFPTTHSQPLSEEFIRNNQRTAHHNLTTKQILEDILNGTDITSLMSMGTDTKYISYTNYKWATEHFDHENVLHELRTIGNSIYSQIDRAFTSTTEYDSMRNIAQRCYDSSDYLFQFWEKVVEMDSAEIVASTPLELSQEIFEHIQKNHSRDNIFQGVRALLYIDQQNPDPEIAQVVRDYASHFIDNMPEGTRKTGKLLKNLQKAVGYDGPVQEVVV
ncbi:hypothetical protein CEE44_00690 [Candidatus Woesearchaeota archaeon B3_Woes]|nr:MAG: hypothetical protein CEE44_00690 [Candidatus Woesearchaeota archaeon B3_Woes]